MTKCWYTCSAVRAVRAFAVCALVEVGCVPSATLATDEDGGSDAATDAVTDSPGDGALDGGGDSGDGSATDARIDANDASDGGCNPLEAGTGRVVVFGGNNGGGTCFDDLYEWTGSDWSLHSVSTRPQGRSWPGMAFDATRSKLVVFGGSPCNSNVGLDDTWEWNGSAWSPITPGTKPGPRIQPGMVYDASRGVVVLFGGQSNNVPLQDTWEYDGSTWTQRMPAMKPAARFAPAMIYDAARRRTVLFGGATSPPNPHYNPVNDTWEWDGTNWTQRMPAMSPAARFVMAGTYDSTRCVSIVTSGSDDTVFQNDTWEYDGTTWTRREMNTLTPARNFVPAAFDPISNKTILFAGQSNTTQLNDTWDWNGTTWTLRSPANPPSKRLGHAMAFVYP